MEKTHDEEKEMSYVEIGYLLGKKQEEALLKNPEIALGYFVGSKEFADLIPQKYAPPQNISKEIFEALHTKWRAREEKNIFLTRIIDEILWVLEKKATKEKWEKKEDTTNPMIKKLEDLRKNLIEWLRNELNIANIRDIILEYLGYKLAQIEKKTRKREIVQTRQLIMFFCTIMWAGSLEEIGERVGGKDHATVLHSKKTINNLLESNDKEMLKHTQIIVKTLGPKGLFDIEKIGDKEIKKNIIKAINYVPPK